ncbi:hypothetical protein LG298_09815 [Cytobacillus firmus]|uniref:hypothetical protein n=1 Tax=Cytobacillus firmus TaxID=1399 RepID=UPI0038511395
MPIYKIDKFVDWVIKELEKLYPGKYGHLVKQYKANIDNSPMPNLKEEKEYHAREVIYNIPGEYYEVFWNIELVKQVISQQKIKVESFPIPQILGFADFNQLDPTRLGHAKSNNNPIILAEFNPLNTLYVIDGNHRLYSQKGSQPSIDGYILNTQQSMDCMAGDLFVNLFKLHYNVTKIFNLGNKPSELKKQLLV